jgi:type IV secretory pathway VirB10-like protein
MPDELKHQLRQLVADPPPPRGVPSEIVYERIRTVRRRRAAGAAAAAVGAVAVVAVAAGTLSGPNSAPPVTHTPSGPETVVTQPPTISPSTSPMSSSPKTSVSASARTLPPVEPTDTPPPTDPVAPSEPTSPAVKPVGVTVRLDPTINGLTVTMRFRQSGSMLAPIIERTGQSSRADSWQNYAYMTAYTWGDGTPGAGANAGLVTCEGAHERVSGEGTDTAREPHTYAKPGTYTFTYRFSYCGPDGVRTTTETMKLTVRATATR